MMIGFRKAHGRMRLSSFLGRGAIGTAKWSIKTKEPFQTHGIGNEERVTEPKGGS